MAEIKAVKDPTPDPKTGKPKAKSGVSVPYYNLKQCEAVARTIHEQGGGACSREQLATLLKYSGTNNGGFLTKVSAAKAFGLVEESGATLRITSRAKAILSPVMPADAEQARIDAFLSIDFFKTIYERFKGTTLPQEAGLKNLLQNTYSIIPTRVVPSLTILQDSAEHAGFFKATGNRSKMVYPLMAGSQGETSQPQNDQAAKDDSQSNDDSGSKQRGKGGGDDGGNDNKPPIPAALLGLITQLPPVGTILLPKRRAALSAAFKSAIDFLYPEAED
jgi:hypothetical protein